MSKPDPQHTLLETEFEHIVDKRSVGGISDRRPPAGEPLREWVRDRRVRHLL